MSNIILKNNTSVSALIYMFQGTTLSGRIPVGANGGSVMVPTTNSYSVTGTITMDDGNTYVTAPASFSSPSQNVLAQVFQNEGTYTFQLLTTSGTTPSAITVSNSCKYPVQFSIKRDGSPLSSVIVVDSYNDDSISTMQTYTFAGVVDGITTEPITSSNPSIVVAVVADNNAVSDFQGYSLAFQRP